MSFQAKVNLYFSLWQKNKNDLFIYDVVVLQYFISNIHIEFLRFLHVVLKEMFDILGNHFFAFKYGARASRLLA